MQKTPQTADHESGSLTAPSPVAEATEKRPFVAPKLTFIEPKLIRHGSVGDITAQGFFGSFSP